ncbi:MAG: hypothetical protein HGA38_05175, partial [Candidatus Moranbacteria bacterium]|nr:hypothetical protein [Candidatus Moranbacteria bacterium]
DAPSATGSSQLSIGNLIFATGGFGTGTTAGTGNVGIGTASPGQKLTVDGTFGILEGGTSPTYHTIFQGGDQSGNITYTLPTGAPASNGYVLSSTTAGVLSWAAAGTGSSTLQADYNATSGNTITTTTGRDIAFTLAELATPTKFSIDNQDTAGTSAEYIKNSIASGTLTNGLLFEQTGAGTVTNAISILETAGTVTTAINIGAGVGTGIKFADTTNTIDMANASNSTLSITNSGTGVASVSIEAGGSYTGAGAVTVSSGGSAGLTIDSASNTTTIASSDTALSASGVTTLTLGNGVTITNGSGNINMQPAGSGTSAAVQIGAGGTGSATPDVLNLDVRSSASGAGDPAGSNGSMYYNAYSNKFRCYENGAWANCIGISSGGSPGGSTNQIQYNNGSGGFGADAGLTFDSTTQTLGLNGTNAEINMTGITAEPSAAASGTLTTYAKSIAGRMMPKWIGPSGIDTPFQPFIGMNHVAWWSAGGGTSVTNSGYAAPSATGTATALATNTTNLYGSMTKLTYRVTTASTSAVAGARGATAQWFLSNQAGVGGFFFVMRGGPDTGVATSTSRFFMGMTASTAAPTDVEPSTIANQIGLGYDAADASLQIIARNGTTLTKTDLNSVTGTTNWNVPTTNDTDMYELILFAPSNTTTINYRVTNLITGAQYSGSTSAGPAVNTLLAPRIWSSVGGTSSVIGVALMSLYIETDQ